MIQTGLFLDLTFHHDTPQGWYLVDEMGVEVLLPNKFCPSEAIEGDVINVFIFRDSEDRLTATTVVPMIEIGQFACLEVVSATGIGAFLDWGLEKDLFVPFKEQHRKLVEGEHSVAYLYRDEVTDRLLASTKISKWLEKTDVHLLYNTAVDLLCFEETEIGFRVIINQKHQGIIYKNEVFQRIEMGDQLKGYVRLVRENGHVDVSLTPMGHKKVSTLSDTVLEAITAAGGFLALHDKSDANLIQSKLGMSKKAFKQTVGVLYKAKAIIIEETGIRKI
ncbi:GntR family transcriptional regulator [Bacteroidota bacterium]|jgi:predicted RNA-binding protein (virulence factor B family)|nr:GntR family transcriptional regulator [Flavobacteriaceae bacterium]PHX77941.1 MAG: GntR family transcriptional regulator [Flavobacteriales bacterium]GDX49441.1 GntR family transcriptional regulator [Bacteroidota bacterium]